MKLFKPIPTIFALFFIVSSCTSLPKKIKPEKHLSYVLTPDQNGKTINVTLEMLGSPTGTTQVKHSKTWAGNNFTEDISDFKILNPGATLTPTTRGHKNHITKILTHKPGEKLKISYKVTQNVESPDKNYRAIIKKGYFHIIGQSGLVTPSVEDDQVPYRITMEFNGFPKDFQFANSFFALKQKHSFVASMRKFLYGVYVGGDYRIKKIMIKKKPLYVSTRGKWKFTDSDLFSLTKNIVTFQRNFFNDHDFDHFFINVLPNGRSCCSSGGTGLTNSFASFLPNDATLKQHVKYLLSHELFHTWNGRRIQRKEPEQLVYWFSEGFTDYYSRLFLLRSGDITLKEYIDDYNEVLYEYYTSNAINYPNQRILKDFWNDYQVEKLPYRRGNILARKWDAQIKTNTKSNKSMDNVLIDFYKESQSVGTLVSDENFIRLSNKYYPGGFKKEIDRFINNGETLTPGANDLGPCANRSNTMIGKFEHGYDAKKTYDSRIITGLKNSSPAYRAGLRNGDKLLSRKIYSPPTRPSSMKVLGKNGKEKNITFLPVTKNRYKAYFFELDEVKFKKDPKKCLAWFKETH